MTRERRLSTFRDEAAFRVAERQMALKGWRAERWRVRPYRPLEGFLDATGGSPREAYSAAEEIDGVQEWKRDQYRAAASPSHGVTQHTAEGIAGCLLLPFYLVGTVVSRLLVPLLGNTRIDVLWVRER